MPTYTYKCRSCKQEFSLEATMQEKDRGLEANCPTCDDGDVFQTFSRVGVLGGSSGGSSCSATSCPSDRSCCG